MHNSYLSGQLRSDHKNPDPNTLTARRCHTAVLLRCFCMVHSHSRIQALLPGRFNRCIYMCIRLPYLCYSPSPDSHAHVHPGNEGGLVHLCSGAGQQTRLGSPYGGCWQGAAGGGVMGMGGHLLHQTFQPTAGKESSKASASRYDVCVIRNWIVCDAWRSTSHQGNERHVKMMTTSRACWRLFSSNW